MQTVEPPVTPTPDPNETPTAQAVAKSKPSLMERLQAFITRYGMLALVVHYAIFGLCLGIFALLIRSGFQWEGATGAAGTFAGAYAACQLIKIPRFAATFALTPLLDRLIRRLRNKGPASSDDPPSA
jgi:uncharacterized RDD family membrane protein YckC